MKHHLGITLVAVAVAVGAGAAVLFNAGCEEATGTHSLTVEPPFVDLTVALWTNNVPLTTTSNTLYTQTFTVTEESLRPLSLPLSWRVSNPLLGSIVYAGGRSASYVRDIHQHGDNAIFVEDQYGAQGTATVRQ